MNPGRFGRVRSRIYIKPDNATFVNSGGPMRSKIAHLPGIVTVQNNLSITRADDRRGLTSCRAVQSNLMGVVVYLG